MSFVVVETCQIFLFDYYYCKNAILWPWKVHFWTKKQKDVICDGSRAPKDVHVKAEAKTWSIFQKMKIKTPFYFAEKASWQAQKT